MALGTNESPLGTMVRRIVEAGRLMFVPEFKMSKLAATSDGIIVSSLDPDPRFWAGPAAAKGSFRLAGRRQRDDGCAPRD